MIGNIAKIIFAVLLGLAFGLIGGGLLGALFGFVLSLIFRELTLAHSIVLMSFLLSIVLGGLLGFIARLTTNWLLGLSESPYRGAVIGAIIGLVIGVFLVGGIETADPIRFERSLYSVPFYYCIGMGDRIGAFVFAILGAAAVIQERKLANEQLRESMKHAHEPSIYTIKNSSNQK